MPARVEDVWWDGDELHLTGYAYIANVPLATRSGPAASGSRWRSRATATAWCR